MAANPSRSTDASMRAACAPECSGRHAHALRRARERRQPQRVLGGDGRRHEASLRGSCISSATRKALAHAARSDGTLARHGPRAPRKWCGPAKARTPAFGAVRLMSIAGCSPSPATSPLSTSQPCADQQRSAHSALLRPQCRHRCHAPDGTSMEATGGAPAAQSSRKSASKGGRGDPRKLKPNKASTTKSNLPDSTVSDASNVQSTAAAHQPHLAVRGAASTSAADRNGMPRLSSCVTRPL